MISTTSSLLGQINVSATIIDSETNVPLPHAYIVLLKPDSTVILVLSSDAMGNVRFTEMAPGDYLLSCSFIGYEKSEKAISIFDGEYDLGTIALRPAHSMLSEVTVTASTVIQKSDRKLLIPSQSQINSSNSGLSLLRNLQLSRIVVNPISQAITTPSGEAVQLRINGIEVSHAEVVALQPQEIIRIEYYEDPGLKYGNAAAVIDYITRRRNSGGSLSTNLTNALWRLGFADDYFSGKVNVNRSEFAANAFYHYRNLEWTRENHEMFLFPNGVLQRDEVGKPTRVSEKWLNVAFNYNLIEPDKYLFNITFRNNRMDSPYSFSDRVSTLEVSNDSIPSNVLDRSTWSNNTPSLDLYYQRNIKNDQLIIVNVVATYVDSKSTRLYQQERANEDTYSSYSSITGSKYSLITEGIYEKMLPSGKLTGGLRHSESYTKNVYSGNVSQNVGLNVSQTYIFTEWLLRKKRLNYTFGLGVMRTFNSQEMHSSEKYIFRPSLRIVYNINDRAYLRFNGYVSGYPPSLSDLNNVRQNIDALQIQQGNPNLKTVWFVSNTVNGGYNQGVIGLELFATYRYDHKPIMEQIFLVDSSFIHTNLNQKEFHRFHSELTFKLRPWKDYLSIGFTPRYNRYFSKGGDYQHTYSNWQIRSSVMATYKRWSFGGDGYMRWNSFWGETLDIGEGLISLVAGYTSPKWGLSVVVFNPFTNEYSIGSKNYSALAPYWSNVFTHNLGQILIFNFSLNLNFGRKYLSGEKRLDNSDSDAGIMTGTKK